MILCFSVEAVIGESGKFPIDEPVKWSDYDTRGEGMNSQSQKWLGKGKNEKRRFSDPLLGDPALGGPDPVVMLVRSPD